MRSFLFTFLLCSLLAPVVSAQSDLVIESFDGSGNLVFDRTSNAVSYRIEWAPTADGPWTNTWAGLNNIPGEGIGSITAAVPMVYRVIATVTNPPPIDFFVTSSGSSAYLINAQSNPTLELVRGQTYRFEINSIGHPFWIKTSPTIGVDNIYTNGIDHNGNQSGVIIFSVPMDAPDTLYYICQFHSSMQGVITISGGPPQAPAGMSVIMAGEFVMGDAFGEGGIGELPLHTNYISGFYMDQYEVTKALWDEVYSWASTNGYSFGSVGPGKAANHPVRSLDWYDAIAWCNARSEREGLTPCYTNANGTAYKTASGNSFDGGCNWSANGYRLPTEAEWEKAARGGVAGQRFPWGDTISHGNANYSAYPSGYNYDVNPSGGYHPTFSTGSFPYTSPVGYFAPNGYGLYDMAGNVREWCWDWYSSSYYSSSPSADPQGPSSGSSRVMRGGSWNDDAYFTRVANRNIFNPGLEDFGIGFRCARGL